ncbi:MAG: recombinase family protein [Clostridia bacterium]|nr:recombinase family protein [Clostridia bacterium]
MRAVIYARYSSDRQTEQSIEGQLRECYSFAEANEITIIDTYIDRAISGKTDNRPAFQQMLIDSAKKQFEAVIVYRLDRFSRNRYDSAVNKQKLKKNGVKVLSAMENLNGTPESIILESMLEGMAEYYSAELSLKIKRGMRENALKCKATGGNLPLGYKVDADLHFIIDEQTAPIVIQIYKMYNEGKTVTQICDTLNRQGLKTSRGVSFNKNSLHTILRNEKYIGVYKSGDIAIPDGVPAIIDKELFYSVGEKMDKNKKAPARAKANVNYMLSTKLFCGECGSNMVGESGTGRHGGKYHYYKCTKRKKEKACNKSNIKKDWIERLVVLHTINEILKDDVIEYIAGKAIEVQERELSNNNTLKYLQSTLIEVERSVKNVVTAIEQGIITESTKKRLVELEEQKQQLEIEIAKENISQKLITKEQIIFFLSSFKGGSIDDEKYCQQIIDTFINAVFVYEDKVVITYNYSGDNNTITVSDLDLSTPP